MKKTIGSILIMMGIGLCFVAAGTFVNVAFGLNLSLRISGTSSELPSDYISGLAFLFLALVFLPAGWLLSSDKVAAFFKRNNALVWPFLALLVFGGYGVFQFLQISYFGGRIYRAAAYDDLGVLQELYLEKPPGASVRRELLFLSLKNNSRGAVDFLLEQGVDVNVRDQRGDTALIFGVWQGEVETLKLLLKRGADVNARGFNKRTALMQLIAIGRQEPERKLAIARLLVEHGVDVKARNKSKESALDIARSYGQPKIYEFLKKQ